MSTICQIFKSSKKNLKNEKKTNEIEIKSESFKKCLPSLIKSTLFTFLVVVEMLGSKIEIKYRSLIYSSLHIQTMTKNSIIPENIYNQRKIALKTSINIRNFYKTNLC